jgi:hypothetical protein
LIVRPVALVNKGHGPITLEVGNRDNRSIDRKLLVVSTKAVTVGIRVGEESRLEDRIGGRLNVGNKVGRRECDLDCRDVVESEIEHCKSKYAHLLNLGKVVLRVLVKNHLTNGTEREIIVRPNFGQIENIVAELFGLIRCHRLLF